jgi:hypothetical protein
MRNWYHGTLDVIFEVLHKLMLQQGSTVFVFLTVLGGTYMLIVLMVESTELLK